MIEKVFTFGRASNLVGVLSEPGVSLAKKGPAVCLLNSGLLHRVGAYRAHVEMARKLADLGYTVFRFDLSGIGDSDKHRDERPYEQQILGDIQEAMDWLCAKSGFSHFVMIGLCTGADNAHKVSVIDERVVGAVLLDGYAYPTVKSYLYRFQQRYGRRVMGLSAWKNMIKNRFGPKRGNASNNQNESRAENYFWSLPEKRKTLNELKDLINRDFKLLSIYSGSGSGYYYAGQFIDMYRGLALKESVQVEYFEAADHTYTLCKDREKMMNAICSWMRSVFPLQH